MKSFAEFAKEMELVMRTLEEVQTGQQPAAQTTVVVVRVEIKR